jgi:hypothetical protein
MTREWESMFPMVHIDKNLRIMSDHSPLILLTRYNQHNKMREFRFELAWLKERECLERVQQIWSIPTRDERVLNRVLFKLKKVKKILKGWGYNRSGSAKLRRKKVESTLFELEQMEEEGHLNESQIRNRFLLRTEFLKMLEDDEIYWSQQCHDSGGARKTSQWVHGFNSIILMGSLPQINSNYSEISNNLLGSTEPNGYMVAPPLCHETWLLQGDNNTVFFHRIANGRKRKQTIYSLEDGGNHISGTENILKHASEFYKQLFGPGMGDTFGIESDMWGMDDMVTQEENIVLISPFSEEEVQKALFQMEKNKAVDPDGIPIEFYQSCWNFIKGDMMALFMEFHEERMDIRRLNYDIITLLPKIKESARIQQYRPMCLLNCIYKWFTKCLTLRLEHVAQRIIHRAHATFLEGRNIMSNILTLHEVLHDVKRKGKVEIVLKLNFEKAYDKMH